MNEPLRLSIVDDHEILRDCLVEKLDSYEDLQVVASFGDGRSCLEHLADHELDVGVVDLRLPDYEGTSLIRAALDVKPDLGIVALTMWEHTRYAMEALQAGARGYVTKGAPFDELVTAIRKVAAGQSYVCQDMARKLTLFRAQGRDDVSLSILSTREFEVLTLLGRGRALKEVADTLGISDKSVTTYRARIMEKLDLKTQADLIRLAIEAEITI